MSISKHFPITLQLLLIRAVPLEYALHRQLTIPRVMWRYCFLLQHLQLCQQDFFPYLIDSNLEQIFSFVGEILSSIMLKVLAALATLVIIDYLFQKKEYEDSLKMSKQEVKDEYKNMEGDPQIKGKIREKQRQMAMQRMMQEIPGADVVITNPTHFAVVLKYDSEYMTAPVLVAKGADLVALRIKNMAKEHGVVVVENKTLARMIYTRVDINNYIPEDLFGAVAEVLAFVYRLRRKA